MKSAGNHAFYVRSRQGLQNPVRWPTADEIVDMAASRPWSSISWPNAANHDQQGAVER